MNVCPLQRSDKIWEVKIPYAPHVRPSARTLTIGKSLKIRGNLPSLLGVFVVNLEGLLNSTCQIIDGPLSGFTCDRDQNIIL
jgi:hypothetical protein